MSLSILYTSTAKATLKNTYTYISIRFGARVAAKFLQKAEKTIALISEHPLMFKSSTIDIEVRIAFITKQCSLFYRVTNTSVQLLYFWDNRQEPLIE